MVKCDIIWPEIGILLSDPIAFMIILWIKILQFYFHIFQSDPDISVLGYPSFIY